ncbi:MAG: DNA polymerase IV, partial [Thermodesulfobacteriota bacterium]
IGVVGSGGRTVVTTCSYEARARGVKTGMNKFEALKACPELIIVIGDNSKYVDASIRMLAILEDFSPLVEVYSIDEAFVDITGSIKLLGEPEGIARTIKERIRDEIGITCSAGIAPTKLMAKLASGMDKPDGLVLLNEADVEGVLEDLPVSKLCGIGPRLTRALAVMGISTCGELAATSASILRSRFGIVGERLSLMGRGVDESPVVATGEERDVKSVGHSMTLPADVTDPVDIKRWILKLSEKVGRRARRHALKGALVTLTIRYCDFYTVSRQKRLYSPTADVRVINRTARLILKELDCNRPVRLVGVSLGAITKGTEQMELFNSDIKREELLMAMDRINDRYGESSVTWGEILERPEAREGGGGVISPAWRPRGVKNHL